MTIRVLVIEDGSEYTEALRRFLRQGFAFTRAGDGPEALERLAGEAYDVAVLDMNFDRSERLLGELAPLVQKLGDEARAREHLARHQGTYILAALRQAGATLPVVFSYDFDLEPRRLEALRARYGPLQAVGGGQGPAELRRAIEAALQP